MQNARLLFAIRAILTECVERKITHLEISAIFEIIAADVSCALKRAAKSKIRRLTSTILGRLADDDLFAASVVLNTQLMLEQGQGRDGRPAPYGSELYALTARIVEQGQREGSVVEGGPLKLVDYYWGVAYLYALKRLFTFGYDMIDAADMERTLLKGGR